jgi:hypothetical protein
VTNYTTITSTWGSYGYGYDNYVTYPTYVPRYARYVETIPVSREDRRLAFKRDYRIAREREARLRRFDHVVGLEIAVDDAAPAPERPLARSPRRGPHRSRAMLGRKHPINRTEEDHAR